MKLKSFLLLIISCVLLIIGCTKPPEKQETKENELSYSAPEAEGIPSKTIAHFFEQVASKGYDVHGLMMLRHGKVIAEHWWAPYQPEIQHAQYSATKTFTGAAVGFAVQEGLLDIEDKMISFFPELLPDTISPQLEKLTVKHLLTMSVGHKPTRYVGSGLSQVRSFLAAPFAYEPGTFFAYNITASHMLSHIITKVTGMTIHDYLKPRLLEPLGIKDVIWEMDNDGINMGNGGTHMKTSDLARMGLFLVNKGRWNGKQLLDSTWVEAATTPHIFQHPEMTEEEMQKTNDDGSQGYGYQIWMGRHDSYRAIGGQNQLIMVIPKYDFILVCHSKISDEAGFNNLIYDMLPSFSDKPLEADPAFDLEAEIADYEIKKPFEEATATKVTMETRRYKMEDNSSNIQTVLFRFDVEGHCYLTLVTPSAIHNIPFGLDTWIYGETDRTFSFTKTVYPNSMGVTPVKTAGIYTWTASNKLSAYYQSFFNPGTNETFHFTFEDENITMEIEAPASLPGPPDRQKVPMNNIVLKGIKLTD
ncbi:serine hydrolase domain-containing protein [Confluentibacter sediminis]|uniref:serine hydrolase domain-containing protein n=1 Tax=Confluentibacter sediminis TaxID=2219045 RepID=UPI0013A6A766|nr:serine hydrolase [Confluentibacter sediminis]